MKLNVEQIVLFSVAYCFVLDDDFFVTGSSSKSKKDHYEILGISKDANERMIKRAFHKMATKYHPDKNKDKGAEEKFREIAQAYEILSDPDERKKYDRFGDAGFENGGGGGGGAFNFGSFDDLFRHFEEPFGQDFFHFSFGGNDFDDFWHDNDEGDPFSSFGFGDQFGGHFGDGDSFFGTHFGQGNGHNSYETEEHRGYKESRTQSSGRSCRTVTQRVGNMVTTYTQCS